MKTSILIDLNALVSLVLALCISACSNTTDSTVPLEEIAANEEVLAFMRSFDGRGALSDSTEPLSPEKSLAAFRHPADLTVSLVLSEPEISQPVFMEFDHRGRLWVVQYNQYPYPKGLKVTEMDQHIRATFDKVPPPPEEGPKGADKISFFEDTDGDGIFERGTDAITGLNIATSVAIGRGKIWVLNPPYLLAYDDADDNGLPDGPPMVHLEGFGLEDTHAVANSLRWGPDGWLYGAQGSTCTANIQSAVSKNVRFNGQAIWRYHPETKVFEVFAEGGGNTFDIEIDAKGRLYSGDNGTSRGLYYKQGAYYVRNFGKHGALTNPFAFGHLANMDLAGDRIRFTHAFIRYEGAELPQKYAGRIFALNPLQRYIQLSRVEERGSTFRVVDEERLVQTEDPWFRPVDITTGPDGAVYVVDWYDSRLSHVDPRDTWSKANGRIYRIAGTEPRGTTSPFDISKLSGPALLELLSHENRWYRQQALRVLADRKDATLIGPLKALFSRGHAQTALEALWALHLVGGFDDDAALSALQHTDPFVRMWAVRLTGDKSAVSPAVGRAIIHLASTESDAEVRSQLAASSKRFPGPVALPVIENLLRYHDDADDPDIPLQIWWALESKIPDENHAILKLFEDRSLWKVRTVRETLLERIVRRYVTVGDSAALAMCARLIDQAPSGDEVTILVNGLQEGLRGRDYVALPDALMKALEPYKKGLEEDAVAISVRQGKEESVRQALAVVSNSSAPVTKRLFYIRIFGETDRPACIPVLLSLIASNTASPALKESALLALQRYDDDLIGQKVVAAYPDRLRADPGVRIAALGLLATRPAWAKGLLDAIDRKKVPGEKFVAHTISKDDVPDHIVWQLKSLGDPVVSSTASRVWPDVAVTTASAKTKRMETVSLALKKGGGNVSAGRQIYTRTCGPCHRLFGEGGTIGPDLTGYDRGNTNDLLLNILDPNAYVREGYVSLRITTADGRVLLGTVKSREGTSVIVKLTSGGEVALSGSEITEMEEQPSMMPDNLLDALTEEEIRDLFAYLRK